MRSSRCSLSRYSSLFALCHLVNAGGMLSISAALISNGMDYTVAIVATINTGHSSECRNADIDEGERVERVLDLGATCYAKRPKAFWLSRMARVPIVCKNQHCPHLEF